MKYSIILVYIIHALHCVFCEGSAYCQLIRANNKEKRVSWAEQYLEEAEDGFEDVIWSDESTIQIETHKQYCYQQKGCSPKSKPRYVCKFEYAIIRMNDLCSGGRARPRARPKFQKYFM